jgi:hypothetical protein
VLDFRSQPTLRHASVLLIGSNLVKVFQQVKSWSGCRIRAPLYIPWSGPSSSHCQRQWHTEAFSVIALCVLGSVSVWADNVPVFSGPQVGEALTPLKVVIPYGEQTGNEIDFVEVADGKPTVLVVVNGTNRPAASLTRVVMHYVGLRSRDELFGGVVWLGQDRTDAENLLKRTRGVWAIGTPLGVSADGSEGPGRYGFNRNVNVTILVANNNRVTANFALIQPSVTDAPTILGEIVKQAGGTVPTRSEIEYLSLMSLPERTLPFPWDNASRQTELRRHICSLLAASDDAHADAAVQRINAYVHDNPDIVDQFKHAVRLLYPTQSNNTYRTHVSPLALGHLRVWFEKYDEG